MIARTDMLRALVVRDRPAPAYVFALAIIAGSTLPAWAAIVSGVVWRLAS